MISSIIKFCKKFGLYYFKVWTLHFFALLCLLTQDPILAVYAIGFFLLVFPLTQLISHDYISHEYCVPRNGLFKFIFFIFWYAYGQTVQIKKNYHIWHHLSYNSDKDPTAALLKGKSLFRYLFSLHEPKSHYFKLLSKGTVGNDKMVKLLDKFSEIIYWSAMIVLFYALPLTWFIVVRIYFPWYITLVNRFHDWYFHGNGPGKDTNWLLPIYGSSAWHIEHHVNWKKEFHGRGTIKFFNLHWWYRNLLFKTR